MNKISIAFSLTGITLSLISCIMDNESKPKPHVIYMDCRDAFDHADSTGYVYDCPVNDTMPANWPKPK